MHTGNHDHWKIAELPWDSFDEKKVDPEIVKIVKAAALVEYNASDYALYLGNVFADDLPFRQALLYWAAEETRHGAALGLWAQCADPTFDFKGAFARYVKGYRINVGANTSVRGSRAGELVARCIVETGTHSYYTALSDATDEPVLKILCHNIATDEARHYKLFHSHLERYLALDKLGWFARLRVGLGRIRESEDDELAYAYFAANAPANIVYNRVDCTTAYMARAYALYRREHFDRLVILVARACGFSFSPFWRKSVGRFAGFVIAAKAKRAIMHDRPFQYLL